MADALTADEAFVTGTLAGITPVRKLDSRTFDVTQTPITVQLGHYYQCYLNKN